MPDLLEDAPPARKPSDPAGFRLALFGAVLVVVLFAGYGIGRLNESVEAAQAAPATAAPADGHGGHGDTAAPHDDSGTAPHVHNADGSVTPSGGGGAAGQAVGGLALSAGPLMLVPESPVLPAGREQQFRFRIAGPGGAAVTTFAVVHDKPLHLVVIRRDLSGFQHVHPVMAPDGTWSIGLTLDRAGSYRAVADFSAIVGGQTVAATLGADLTVAGNYTPEPLPAPARVATAPGGFQVTYEGTPRTESTQPLVMVVAGPGGAAARLEPYLGAYGHLVVFREGDVGYVHVHPEAELADGKVKFWVAAPSPGRYRMFFDFQVAGVVHTAAWTVTVG